jgi:hypothetical protein
VDLDKLSGKWFGLYGHHSGQKDVSTVIVKNSNTSSQYSHTYQKRFDDHLFKGNFRLDESGILYATSTNHLSAGEFKYNVLDVDYNSHLISYKCIEFDGSLSRIGISIETFMTIIYINSMVEQKLNCFFIKEKFHVLSRSCSIDKSIKERATKLAREI